MALFGFLALCLGTGALGSWATIPNIEAWYRPLAKPPLTPPDWIFGPVWTTLYVLIGVSGWLIFTGKVAQVVAWRWYGAQLALNAVWSWLFFGLHRPGWALADLIGMWVAIVFTIRHFRRNRPVAAWLLVPYLLWVSFAGYLNGGIWWLNR